MLQGFTKATSVIKQRLIVSTRGLDKHGKSSFALSSPGPIIYFNFDFGLEGVVHKYAKNKSVYIKDYKVKRGDTSNVYFNALEAFKQDYYKALTTNARSVVLDTATELWELIRLARLGGNLGVSKEASYKWGPINAEYIGLIREAYDHDKNLILLHKAKKEYVDDKFTGKYELDGYKYTPGLVQVNTVVYREGLDGDFYLKILNCRQNATIAGMECPLIDEYSAFPMLAQWVFPESKYEDWV